MDRPPLACTVRGCGLPLQARSRAFVCPRGHAYDIARSGYVNLLQPQDRRSPLAGDAGAIVEARLRLQQGGIGAALLDACAHAARSHAALSGGAVVDLGCGTGDAVAAVARQCGMSGLGIDLSAAAVTIAARRFPDCTWVVANADRRLPLVDHAIRLVLSLHARRQPAECARVLERGGRLLVAVPAPDDLIEVRRLVHGQAVSRDRTEAVIGEHQAQFTLVGRSSVRETAPRSRETVLDLLKTTYRGARASAADRAAAIGDMDVTLASDLLIFEPASS